MPSERVEQKHEVIEKKLYFILLEFDFEKLRVQKIYVQNSQISSLIRMNESLE
jgi:hypothetical protein